MCHFYLRSILELADGVLETFIISKDYLPGLVIACNPSSSEWVVKFRNNRFIVG